MIPKPYIAQWQSHAPWKDLYQIEQDLIISRALVAIFSDPFLNENLAFRGGTALHKLYLNPAPRYSEDIDLVQIKHGPIKPIMERLQETELGKNRILQMDSIPKLHKNRIRSAYGKKLAIAESPDINQFYLECWYQKKSGTIDISVRNDLNQESIKLLEDLTKYLQSTIFSAINGVIVDNDPLNTYNIK